MTDVPYDKPEDAPPTKLAADGKTTLHAFEVTAVIYARSQRAAERQIEAARIYFDHAKVVEP